MAKMKNNRVGEISKNRYGRIMKIIKYNGCEDVDVAFENGYITNCYYKWFKNGVVSNPLDKTSYNIGYLGVGEYMPSNRAYSVWRDMFKRCYDLKYLSKFNTYIGCTVCEEWHNYQNFAKWYDENYYKIDEYRMELDKDILHKGNKIYSPKTCVFVPQEVNYLFVKSNKSRGEYPIGVYLHSDGDKYVAQCCDINKKAKYLGRYDTIEETFEVYKDYKEDVIKRTADKYYGLIPDKLYKAMYNYVVDIAD